MAHPLKRVLQFLIWIGVAAGVSFFVANNVTSGNGDPTTLPDVELINTSNLEVVSLSEQLIAPVVSGEGRVISEGDSWLLEAEITPESLAYQLLDAPFAVRALISGGPVGFECAWAGIGVNGVGAVTMRCRIPDSVRVAEGLRGSMVLQMSQPTASLSLPRSAVIGSADQGLVIVVLEDGTTELRTLSLGVSDSFFIEITGGLNPNEQVIAYPTQIDVARASR